MNDFVNPKKRSIQLPKGSKDLADVLHASHRRRLRKAGYMIRVINSIPFDEQALQSDPNFLEKVGPGLLVILDLEQKPPGPEEKPSFLVELGSTVRIHRPDGASFDRTVGAIEIWGAHVGLYLPNTVQDEIPRLSEIELPD